MSETTVKRKQFRRRRESSSSSSEASANEDETNQQIMHENIKEKIEELKLLQKQRERKHGIDVYSLAIGEQQETQSSAQLIENDPWRLKTGGLVDMKRLKEKRGAEIVQNMNSNFAKETNQRDEDAEMQKFIEEQLRLKKEQDAVKLKEKSDKQHESLIQIPEITKFKRPEDALFDVPKFLLENTSKHKSEETLSEQMLSGIPEVDLGIDERIRNIEDTERARQEVLRKKTSISNQNLKKNDQQQQYVPSVNFVQHKRFDDALINPDHMIKLRQNRPNTNRSDSTSQTQQPVVGDAPKHELLQHGIKHKLKSDDATKSSKKSSDDANHSNENKKAKKSNKASNSTQEKASDDYCLERFKKNMRFNRNSKIKIC